LSILTREPGEVRGDTRTPDRPRRSQQQKASTRTFWLFTSPWTLGFVLLSIFPLLYGLYVSFTDYSPMSMHTHFVGLENYKRALHDPTVGAAFLRAILIPAIIVPLTVGLGLVLALLANQPIRFRSWYRAIFYLPVIIPPLSGAVAFRTLFDQSSGPVNSVLAWFGASPVDWMSGKAVFVVLLLLILWTVGGNMILSLAALQDVPTELLEAAKLDGAGPVRTVVSVVIPIISPVLFYQAFMGVIAALQIAVPALLLGGFTGPGGFPRELDTIMVHILREFFSFGRIGYGSALTWLMFMMLLVVASGLFMVNRRLVHYTSDPEEGRR
jgi:multiple sugar transport system permease protein